MKPLKLLPPALLAAALTAAQPPNFVVIVCDNLGYGDIEPFGSKLQRTPHLERMAREGRKFTHFYAVAGVCTPSRAGLMTGAYAQRVGMHCNPRDGHVLRPVSPYGLHPDEVTIAEALKTRGYATALIGKWHLGDQPEFLPVRQGFDSYFGIPYSDDMTRALGARAQGRFGRAAWPPLPLVENETVIEAPVDRSLLTKRYTERALRFIEANRRKPFFLCLAHAMPGSTPAPFASEAFRGKSRNGPWGDAVEELDWSAGRILDTLTALGLAENTFVLWTSDNGAPRAGGGGAPVRGSNEPLYGSGYTTAEGAFRAPALMWWPGKIPANTVSDELLTTMDLLPTLASWAGAELAADRRIDGRNAAAVILGEKGARSPHEAFYYYERDQLQAVRSGPWKLFVALENFDRHPHLAKGAPPRPLLFHLLDDIGCERNVAADHPEVVARLEALAEKARADLGDRGRPGAGQRRPGRVESPQPLTLDAPHDR